MNPGVISSWGGATLIYPYRKTMLSMFNPRAGEALDHSGVMLSVIIW